MTIKYIQTFFTLKFIELSLLRKHRLTIISTTRNRCKTLYEVGYYITGKVRKAQSSWVFMVVKSLYLENTSFIMLNRFYLVHPTYKVTARGHGLKPNTDRRQEQPGS